MRGKRSATAPPIMIKPNIGSANARAIRPMITEALPLAISVTSQPSAVVAIQLPELAIINPVQSRRKLRDWNAPTRPAFFLAIVSTAGDSMRIDGDGPSVSDALMPDMVTPETGASAGQDSGESLLPRQRNQRRDVGQTGVLTAQLQAEANQQLIRRFKRQVADGNRRDAPPRPVEQRADRSVARALPHQPAAEIGAAH